MDGLSELRTTSWTLTQVGFEGRGTFCSLVGTVLKWSSLESAYRLLRDLCSDPSIQHFQSTLSLRPAQLGEHPPIVRRTFDLKSAYKQFGLRTKDQDLIRIGAVDPTEGKPVLCGLNALPFAGVGSVAGLKLCWTWYFDDFSTVTRPELQNNAAWAVHSLFGLIGFDYAHEGAKAPEC